MQPQKLVFGKKNYQIMIIGIAVILAGFLTMTLDKETYGFGFLGITLGPLLIMIGFAIEFVAILYKEKKA